MNLKEGTRRTALLLGVVGAILGGFVSYIELQPALEQRANHIKFEQLAASDVVQLERKAIQVPGFGPPEDVPPKFNPNAPYTSAAPSKTYLDDNGNPISQAQRIDSEVNKKGITAIHWTDTYGVKSIETDDGQTLYPTPAPSAWLYCLIALFPFFGFFIPWGAIRAIGWVGAGFTAEGR